MKMRDRGVLLFLSTVAWLYYQPLGFSYPLILALEMAEQFSLKNLLLCSSFASLPLKIIIIIAIKKNVVPSCMSEQKGKL